MGEEEEETPPPFDSDSLPAPEVPAPADSVVWRGGKITADCRGCCRVLVAKATLCGLTSALTSESVSPRKRSGTVTNGAALLLPAGEVEVE